MAHLAYSAVSIVGCALDKYGYASRPKSLVPHVLIVHAIEIASAAFDGTLDVILRHILRHCLIDGGSQSRISCRIFPTKTRGSRDLAD